MALALLDINRAAELAVADPNPADPDAAALLALLRDRKLSLTAEMARFAMLCDRWDNLYYPQSLTAGGASHWAQHSSARLPGRSHVSVNVYPAYVDIPAAMESETPIENMVAVKATEGALAAAIERTYSAWKDAEDFDNKVHKACVTKELYGRTAAKVYWDEDLGHPTVEIVDNPRNLWLGWRDSNYQALEWCLYTYAITPSTALEDWGLEVQQAFDKDGQPYPYVVWPSETATWMASMIQTDMQVEVYDYWYRRPAKNARVRFGKPTKFETWNAIFVGNALVKNERHPEYKGRMPYVPLFNSYIPGVPDGRSALYDVEQLIREKDERMSETAQMMSKAINGQMWQLIGDEADTVPVGLVPTPNKVIAPGAGNRIEALQPWMPEFQTEQYFGRIDRELVDVSGMNDLIRGLAPSEALNSGKAVQALTSNFETRIKMRREMLYIWRASLWDLSAMVWGSKAKELAPIFDGRAKLVQVPPNLVPRDDAEASSIAANMKGSKIWSGKRAMDRMGVEDPEREEDIIRAEQTDATLNPAEVQVMAQLLGILRNEGIAPQPQVQQAVQQQAGALNDVRALNSGAPAAPGQNGPEAQQGPPPDQLPGNVPGALSPAGAPDVGGQDLTLQTAIKGGQANSRILQQQRITTQAKNGPGG